MKNRFNFYAIGWAVLFVLFNIISFVSPGWIWFEKLGVSFWIGYALITLTFIGQLACAFFALKEERATKLFYNVSLITTSYTGLIATFVIGGLCMVISPLPYWICVIACSIVLAVNVIATVKVAAAIDIVATVDEKVKTQTYFIKSLTVDADTLISKAKSDSAKAECKKIYEAVRYSDPMSNDALASVEHDIEEAFAKFSHAVVSDDENVAECANELSILLTERNKKCKFLK